MAHPSSYIMFQSPCLDVIKTVERGFRLSMLHKYVYISEKDLPKLLNTNVSVVCTYGCDTLRINKCKGKKVSFEIIQDDGDRDVCTLNHSQYEEFLEAITSELLGAA